MQARGTPAQQPAETYRLRILPCGQRQGHPVQLRFYRHRGKALQGCGPYRADFRQPDQQHPQIHGSRDHQPECPL